MKRHWHIEKARRGRSAAVRLAGAAVIVTAGACAAHQVAPPVTTHIVLDEPRSEPAAEAVMPPLPVTQTSLPQSDTRQIREFHAADEDLTVVLREIAEGFGLDYRIAPEVTGRVNVRLQGVSLDDALRQIIRPHGYEYQLQDRVLYVGPPQIESRLFSLDYVALSRVGQSTTVVQRRMGGVSSTGGGGGVQGIGGQGFQGGGSDFVTSTSVADLWGEIRIALEALIFSAGIGAEGAVAGSGSTGTGIGQGTATTATSRVDELGRKLVINPMAGTILVHAPQSTLTEVADFLRVFEASVQRQVLIEAKIVEVQLDRNNEYGIDWSVLRDAGDLLLSGGNPAAVAAGGLQFTLQGGAGQITAVLRTLSEQGDVRVLSSPQVSALNNQRAIFNVTTDEVIFTVDRQPIIGPTGATIGFNNSITTNQVAVGIVLDVFPQIGPDNTVSMNIRPAITNVARIETIRTEDGSEARAPVIDRREVDTFARVRPGETIVIGGLMQTRREKHRTGIPLLKDLPILGYLFGRTVERETRGELVIFITPTIVSGQLREGG